MNPLIVPGQIWEVLLPINFGHRHPRLGVNQIEAGEKLMVLRSDHKELVQLSWWGKSFIIEDMCLILNCWPIHGE